MEIKTKCMICSNNIALHSCRNCGSLVCNDCYDKLKKLCIECSTGKI